MAPQEKIKVENFELQFNVLHTKNAFGGIRAIVMNPDFMSSQ